MIAYYNQKSNLIFDNNFPVGSTVYDPEAEKIGIVIDETGIKYLSEEETPVEPEETVTEEPEVVTEIEEVVIEEEPENNIEIEED